MREGRVYTIMGRHRNLYDASYNYNRNNSSKSRNNNCDEDDEESDDVEGDYYDNNGTTQQVSSSSSSPSFQQDTTDIPTLNRELYELKKIKRMNFKNMDFQVI